MGGTFTLTFNGQTTIPPSARLECGHGPGGSAMLSPQSGLGMPPWHAVRTRLRPSPSQAGRVERSHYRSPVPLRIRSRPRQPLRLFSTRQRRRFQSCSQALPGIGAGNATVQQDTAGRYVITFTGALGNQNVKQLTVSNAGLTGGSPTVAVSTSVSGTIGNNGYSDVQGGSVYTITFTACAGRPECQSDYVHEQFDWYH